MGNYVLSCCSTADLTREHFERRDIRYICFHFYLDGKEYSDDLGASIPFDDFYRAMLNGADTRTSQINTDEFVAYFTPFLDAGQDILHVSLSSGISGVYGAAAAAAKELSEKYPERKIRVVDSLGAASGYGLLMDRLADLRDSGMGIDEVADWAEENKLELNLWFISTDLTFFVKGGRVSKVSGFFGTALNICPLLNVDYVGKLIPREKVRTKKRVLQRLADCMTEHAKDRLDYSGKCYISHSYCYEDARYVADLIEARFPKLDGKVEIYNIGTTIGSHTGPGTVALFFWGDKRIN